MTTAWASRSARLVAKIVDGRDEVRLGDMARTLERLNASERVEQHEQVIQAVTTREVAMCLRRLGFRRTGWTGHGYDREPVYSRAAT